ncbi:MAG: hypothetical protein JXB26_09690 [Candidatus Aminicenantes bacterium]|nr:hypothetical protein [Candidatus Aminicenantes bacterium]
MHLGALVFPVIIAYMGLRQPEIFSGLNEKSTKQKYAKTTLPQGKMEQYLDKLIRHMETKKPYLNAELNLNQPANEVSISAHHISQILNHCLNLNFYHFMNKFRIEEFKRIMSKKTDSPSILEALYEAGFCRQCRKCLDT